MFHQRPGAFRRGLGGDPRPRAPDDLKQAAVKVPRHHVPGKFVGLVGVYRHPDAFLVQPGQQFRHARVGRRLVEFVGAVLDVKLFQRGGQLFRRALRFRAEPLHQFGDAVAHKITVLRHIVGGPAVGRAHPVGGIRQVVDGVQQGAVQIKQYSCIHSPCSLFIVTDTLIIVAWTKNGKTILALLPIRTENSCKFSKKTVPCPAGFMV